MRVIAAAFVIASLTVSTAPAQESNIFKDWAVGCDNLRGCTALGLPAEDGGGAYIKVVRSGEAEAEPEVDFVLYSSEAVSAPELVLAFDDPSLEGLPEGPLPASGEDSFIRASITGEEAYTFLAAAQKGASLTIGLAGGAEPPSEVSLSGATAALLYVDDRQKRVGTTTALARPGSIDPATIPPAPAAPIVTAVTMRDLSDRLPPFPPGISKPGADTGCPEDSIIAVRLSGVLTLWGVCDSAGAYNYSYAFSLAEAGTVTPALFELPQSLGESMSGLTNPYVEEDGRTLSAFDKGRGIGDCGVAASWAWDGRGFRLVSYAAMDDCRGVLSDDWPGLYRARVE